MSSCSVPNCGMVGNHFDPDTGLLYCAYHYKKRILLSNGETVVVPFFFLAQRRG